MKHVVTTFSSSLLHIRTIDEALELYNLAVSMPKTDTRLAIEQQTHIRISAPLSKGAPQILTATDKDGKPITVKILGFTSTVQPEEDVWKKINQLQDQSISFVRAIDFVNVNVPDVETASLIKKPAATYRCAIMPRYIGAVSDVAPHSNAVILAQGTRIKRAIETIHSLGYVHMDIKLSNFFVSNDGQWFLGDFGSAVEIGKQIKSYTPSCHPDNLSGKVAETKYDWAMFVVALVTESRRYNNQKGSRMQYSWTQLEEDIAAVSNEDLQIFLLLTLKSAR